MGKALPATLGRHLGRVALTAALACGLSAPTVAAPLATPPDWRAESFRFPLPYAPSLPYEGTEQVRFSPSWAHFAAADGFSYVVLWDIKPALLEGVALERALEVYFDGLMNNVANARRVDAMVAQTAVRLHPLRVPQGWAEAYAGAIHTWNGFSRAQPLVLNVEIARRDCGPGRLQVFFAFSQAPRDAPVWDSLRALRRSAGCGS